MFIHIPKTAGSSIRHALEALKVPTHEERMADQAGTAKTYHETYRQFLDAYEERTGNPVETARALRPIAFIRNPYTRFMSVHAYLTELRPGLYPDLPRDINDFAAAFDAGEGAWVHKIRGLRPQSDFLAGTEDRADRFLGRFESIKDDIKRLEDFIGEPLMQLPHKKKSSVGKKDYRDVLSDKTLDILRKKYAVDFTGLDYPL